MSETAATDADVAAWLTVELVDALDGYRQWRDAALGILRDRPPPEDPDQADALLWGVGGDLTARLFDAAHREPNAATLAARRGLIALAAAHDRVRSIDSEIRTLQPRLRKMPLRDRQGALERLALGQPSSAALFGWVLDPSARAWLDEASGAAVVRDCEQRLYEQSRPADEQLPARLALEYAEVWPEDAS